MSRDLPAHADIEHLRKQAKERLRELRTSDPRAKLTDAQHAIAREYGFASWPRLRAHVASPGDRVDYRFERFTPKARRALFFSRAEASQSGSMTIEPEHILLGLVRAGLKSRWLERAGLSLTHARAEVAPRTAVRAPLPSSIEIPFSDSTKRVLRAANAEADRLVHDNVGIAHVLLGLLAQPEGAAASALIGRGVNAQGVRRDIAALLNEESS